MTLEKAIEILDKNIILSPKASQFKEAIEVMKFALRQKKIEINLDEAFMKECECEIKKAREQAVREFAEKLKEQAFECDISCGLGLQRIRQAVAVDDIDTLVNELFGISEQQEGEENG